MRGCIDTEAVDVRLQVAFKKLFALSIAPGPMDFRQVHDLLAVIVRRTVELTRVDEFIMSELVFKAWYPLVADRYREPMHPRAYEELAHYRPEVLAVVLRALSILGEEEYHPWLGWARSPHFSDIVFDVMRRSPENAVQILLYLRPLGRFRRDEPWEEFAIPDARRAAN